MVYNKLGGDGVNLTDYLSVTELSRLTGKTRPTIYKYITSYEKKKYDDIPYSFLMLLRMADDPSSGRADILTFCAKNFGNDAKDVSSNGMLHEVIRLISDNHERIDLKRLKKNIEAEIKKNEK